MKALAIFAFAWVCFMEPASATQDLDQVKQWMLDSNNDLRRRAVQAVPGLGSAEAWELLLGALADPEPRVADEAQLQLGKLEDVDVLEKLVLKKSGLKAKDELVRARVAEALGRMSVPVPTSALGKAMSDKDVRVRRTVAWSIERLAARDGGLDGSIKSVRTPLLKAAKKDKDPGVRAAAMLAMAVADPQKRLDLIEIGLEDKRESVRIATFEVLGGSSNPLLEAFAMSTLLTDEAWGPRRAAVEVLEQIGSKPAVAAMIGALNKGVEDRLRWDLVGALRRLSGLKHGADPRPWGEWLESLPRDWTGEQAEGKDSRDFDVSVSFAGLSVLSSRVAFLIDLSGSMKTTAGSKGTRKDIAAAALEKALEAMPPTTRFNVIPYYDQPVPWKKELVEAKPANIDKALAFFDGTHQTGKGNFWDAFELAFEDTEIDTVIVFTDGAPSGGPHWNFDLMHELLVEKNRFRKLTIEAVLVDPSGIARKFWSNLCKATGGRAVEAKLD